jgi:hypothetical protein
MGKAHALSVIPTVTGLDSTHARVPSNKTKQNQANSKQNQTNLIGFVWWNLDFSKGYSRKNKK